MLRGPDSGANRSSVSCHIRNSFIIRDYDFVVVRTFSNSIRVVALLAIIRPCVLESISFFPMGEILFRVLPNKGAFHVRLQEDGLHRHDESCSSALADD